MAYANLYYYDQAGNLIYQDTQADAAFNADGDLVVSSPNAVPDEITRTTAHIDLRILNPPADFWFNYRGTPAEAASWGFDVKNLAFQDEPLILHPTSGLEIFEEEDDDDV